MVALALGDLADLIRERKGFGEAVEREYPSQPLDSVLLDQIPVRDLRLELCDLVVGDRRRVGAARHARRFSKWLGHHGKSSDSHRAIQHCRSSVEFRTLGFSP